MRQRYTVPAIACAFMLGACSPAPDAKTDLGACISQAYQVPGATFDDRMMHTDNCMISKGYDFNFEDLGKCIVLGSGTFRPALCYVRRKFWDRFASQFR